MEPTEFVDYLVPHLRLIPEEELALCELLLLRGSREYFLACIWMNPGVIYLTRYGHRGRSEVLHLFKMEVESFSDAGEFRHISLLAGRMRGNEIGNKLLVESVLAVDVVEYLLEVVKQFERRFPHAVKHTVGSMLRSHFKASADMACDQFFKILRIGPGFVRCVRGSHREIVTHAAPDKGFLYSRQRIYASIYIGKRGVVVVKVGTWLRMQTRRLDTSFTYLLVFPAHSVHIGRRTSQIRDVSFEILHLRHLSGLFED